MIEVAKQLFCSVEGCENRCVAKGLCKKHYNRQWKEDNKEHCVGYRKQWRQNNPEYFKQYHIDNKEKLNEQSKQCNFDNKESKAEYDKQWYQNNKEHMAEYHRKYRKQYRNTLVGKANIRVSNHNRRALTKDLTSKTVQRVYEDNIKQYGVLTCILCGKPVEFKDSSLEHLTPLSRGGNNDYENLGVAHLICNIKKRAMTLDEWFKR